MNPTMSLQNGIRMKFSYLEGSGNPKSRNLKQTKIMHYLYGALAATTKKCAEKQKIN